MAQLVLNLPPIDGAAELGLAVGIDPSLAHNLRLRVRVGGTLADRAMEAAVYVLRNQAIMDLAGQDNARREFLVNSAIAVVYLGMIARDDPNGDVTLQEGALAPAITPAEADAVNAMYSDNKMIDAGILIMATKITYWQMNHHVGQGFMQGYVKKVFTVKFPDASPETWLKTVHTVGHWGSSVRIFHMLEFPEMRVDHPFNDVRGVTGSDDVRLRVQSCPAGTAVIAVNYAACMKLLRSPMLYLFPMATDLEQLIDAFHAIRAHPTRYHVGAQYLTGYPKEPLPAVPMTSGRLGSYMSVFFPNHTLMRSPQYMNGNFRTAEDFDPAFEASLTNYRASMLDQGQVSEALQVVAAPNALRVLDILVAAGVPPSPTVAAVYNNVNEGADLVALYNQRLNPQGPGPQ